MSESTRNQGIFVSIGCVLSIVLSIGSISYLSAERKADEELIRPRMLELAKQNNPEAIRWAYRQGLSEFKNWSELYAKLAELEDPEGMYNHAYLIESKDPATAFKWYEMSAAKGYPSAVLKIAKPEKGLF